LIYQPLSLFLTLIPSSVFYKVKYQKAITLKIYQELGSIFLRKPLKKISTLKSKKTTCFFS